MTKKNIKNQDQEEPFLDSIFLECSREQAMEKSADNHAIWRNQCGSGVVVNPGDTIEVNSAYINANGAGDGITSISFDGRYIGKKTYSGIFNPETFNLDATQTFDTYDNQATIRIQFFKNNNACNCIHLPCPRINSNVFNELDTGVTYDPRTNPISPIQKIELFDESGFAGYTQNNGFQVSYFRNERIADNSRFTIFKKVLDIPNANTNRTDLYQYYRYTKFITLKVDKGFNNVSNVAESITEQLNKRELQQFKTTPIRKTIGNVTDNNFDLDTLSTSTANPNFINKPTSYYSNSPCFEAIPAPTRYNFSNLQWLKFYDNQYDEVDNLNNGYFRIFDYVGYKNPDFVEAGIEMSNNSAPFIFDEDITPNPRFTDILSRWTRFTFDWNKKEFIYKLFEAQRKTPNLINNTGLNSVNQRFLHIAAQDNSKLGSDLDGANLSYIMGVDINLAYYGKETIGTREAPWKGFLVRIDDHTVEMSITLFLSGQVIYDVITAGNRWCGYDRHFSAYGNTAVALYNGLNYKQDPNDTLTNLTTIDKNAITENSVDWWTDIAIDYCYIGADQALFNFNEKENKFEFSNLHCSEKSTNNPYALNTNNTADYKAVADLNPDAGTNVYYINPGFNTNIWQPQMVAANFDNGIPNNYLKRLCIFDAHSSIGILDFGVDDTNNKNNLFYRLGFAEEQIKPNLEGDFKDQVINNFNDLSYPLTTNAQREVEDVMEYYGSVKGASFFTPLGFPLTNASASGVSNAQNQIIINPQISSVITAQNIASKTNHSFYSIRSDIIGQSNYIGSNNNDSGQILNCVSIVSKENRIDDFLFLSPLSNMIFTFKKRYTIQGIQTGIFNNDGSPAVIDDKSTVIYKIVKRT
jgi:hypothetical protein